MLLINIFLIDNFIKRYQTSVNMRSVMIQNVDHLDLNGNDSQARGSEFSSFEIELQNRVAQYDVTP